ncbi:MAG: hypothetical protein KatS3mg022_1817 [Armatimonadota bacterium]|nr:MAG: hypothetical protein KatS3mg022_1817 [Armatimonadota bacterium]
MARRLLVAFVLALLPVVAVIVHPELRRVARQDILTLFGGTVGLHTLPNDIAERQEILRLENIPGEAGTWQRVRQYALMAREARQPYLYAAALRAGMQFRIYPRSDRTLASPESDERTRQMAQQLLSIADEMLAIDSDNSFPHLIKACALFALGQDEKAIASFLDAAACSRYEDYIADWSRVLASPSLSAEERTLLIASVILPHLSCFRETALHLVSLAHQQQKKGQHTRALALREAVAEVGTKMRVSRGSLVTALVGIYLQRVAWNGQVPSASSQEDSQSEQLLTIASRFADYARLHGRADLAQKAMHEAALSQETMRKAMAYSRQDDLLQVGWLAPLQRMMSMRMAGMMLLLWSFAMAFLLGASLMLSPLWKNGEADRDTIAPVTSSLVVSGVFVAVAVGGAFALDGFRSIGTDWLEQHMLGERIPSLLFAEKHFTILHASTCAILCAQTAVGFTLPLLHASRITRRPSLAWLVALGILLALSVVSAGVIQSTGNAGYNNMVLAALAIAAGVWGIAGLIASPFYAFVLHKSLPEPLRGGIAALWGLASIVAWTGFLTETALWLAAGLLLWLIWGRSLPEDARAETQRTVYRFGMSALILAIFGLWLYAILGYASLPARAQQHAYLDQMIKHGEMSLLQQVSE